ncbi:MAG: hypothetical protein H6816_15810, partial [Phycisphaerales bacterium]|nr:hypothetical protein [Phycisphaerales bacterium]
MKLLHVLILVPLIAPLAAAVDVFSYPPSPTGGILGSAWLAVDGSDADVYAYNDFILAGDEAITEVRWRGGYTYGGLYGKAYHFTITFFATNVTGNEPLIQSLPDPVGEPCLANYQVNGNAGETLVGTVGGVAMYDYLHVLPTPFLATGGVKYWIRIVAWQPSVPDWGLSKGTGGNGSHFHYSTGTKIFQNWPGDTSFTLGAAWKNLGHALGGSNGVPSLVGTGRFTAGAAGALALTNAKKNSTAFCIVGSTAIDAPFYGGTLVPAPTILFSVATGSTGSVALPFTLPPAAPPGLTIYVQYWIVDAGAPLG